MLSTSIRASRRRRPIWSSRSRVGGSCIEYQVERQATGEHRRYVAFRQRLLDGNAGPMDSRDARDGSQDAVRAAKSGGWRSRRIGWAAGRRELRAPLHYSRPAAAGFPVGAQAAGGGHRYHRSHRCIPRRCAAGARGGLQEISGGNRPSHRRADRHDLRAGAGRDRDDATRAQRMGQRDPEGARDGFARAQGRAAGGRRRQGQSSITPNRPRRASEGVQSWNRSRPRSCAA